LGGASGFVGSNPSREREGKGQKMIPLGRKEFFLSSGEQADLLKPAGSIINLGGTAAVLSTPEFVLCLQFGEGAQVLTSVQHGAPERLLASSFDFELPDIEEAIADRVK